MAENPNQNHFEAPKSQGSLSEVSPRRSFLAKLLSHVVALIGLLFAVVLGIISGFASCVGVVVVGNGGALTDGDGYDFLLLGAAVGIAVFVAVLVLVYRAGIRMSQSMRQTGIEDQSS